MKKRSMGKRWKILAGVFICMCTCLASGLYIAQKPTVAVAEDISVNLAEYAVINATNSYNDNVWQMEYVCDGDKLWVWGAEPSEGRTLGWRTTALDGEEDKTVVLSFDFGEIATVNSVIMYPNGSGNAFPVDYEIEYCDANDNWHTAKTVTGDTSNQAVARTHTMETSLSATALRIVMTKPNAVYTDNGELAYELSEVEIPGIIKNTVTFHKNNIGMTVGEEEVIQASLRFGGNNGFDYAVTGETGVIDLRNDGTYRALKSGQTEITATEKSSGLSNTVSVTVYQEQEENIMISVPVWGNTDAITPEQFQWLKEADVDAVMSVGHASKTLSDKMHSIVQDMFDFDAERNLWFFPQSTTEGINVNSSEEDLRAYVERQRNTLGLIGYHLEDEPYNFSPYAWQENVIRSMDPDAITDTNALPGGAYPSMEEYYNRFADYSILRGENGEYISFDNYPFGLNDGDVDEGALFGNMDVLRRAGNDYGVKTAFYLQAVGTQFYGYRRPSASVMRYHAGAGLAYGFKWIKYYSWFVPGHSNTPELDLYTSAIMDHDFQKTAEYDAQAILHKQIHNVGEMLVKLNAEEIYHSGSKSQNSEYERVPTQFFVQAENDGYAIFSLMRNRATGQQYLMIVNKDFDNAQTLNLRFSGISKLVEISKQTAGVRTDIALDNGKLTLQMDAGDFMLYELPEGFDGRLQEKAEESTNILANAKIMASASFGGDKWFIPNVFDGITTETETSGGWRVDGEGDEWLSFGFGKPTTLNRVDLYPIGNGNTFGNLYPKTIEVLVSDDGTNYRSVYKDENITRPTTRVPVIRFESVTTNYLKLVFGKNNSLALAEICVFNDDGSIPLPLPTSYEETETPVGENLAFGCMVTASNSLTDTVWDNGLTDNVIGASYPTSASLGWNSGYFKTRDVSIYAIVDLGCVRTFNEVILYPRGNGGICFPEDYQIQVSSDYENWETVTTVTGDVRNDESARAHHFDSVEGQYVRIYVTKLATTTDNGAYACQISEVQVVLNGNDMQSNSIYAFKDFYRTNASMPNFDGVMSSKHGLITYASDYSSMRVSKLAGNAYTMRSLSKWNENFTYSKYLVLTVVNEFTTAATFTLSLSDVTSGGRFMPALAENGEYYLVGKYGGVEKGRALANGGINLPVNFEGKIYIPTENFAQELDKMHISGVALGLPAEACDLTFGMIGRSSSDVDVNGNEPNVFDNSSYNSNKPNLFYSWGNIYKSYHDNNLDWWEGVEAFKNAQGAVSYNEDYTQMRVQFLGAGGGTGGYARMWGYADNCFNMSDAVYLVIYAKNNATHDSWFGPMISDLHTDKENFDITGGTAYIVDGENTTKTYANKQGLICLPQGFDGYVLIEPKEFKGMWGLERECDWRGITRISYKYEWYVSDITFGEVGWAISTEALNGQLGFVRPAPASVNGFDIKDKSYDGTPPVVNNGAGEVIKLVYYKYENRQFVETNVPQAAGIYMASVLYRYNGTEYYHETTFSIEKGQPAVTVTANKKQTIGLAPSLAIDTKVKGTLTTNVEALKEGENVVNWTFTPEDSENYESVSGSITVTVEAPITQNGTSQEKKGCGSIIELGGMSIILCLTVTAFALMRKREER